MARVPNVPVNKPPRAEMVKTLFIRATNSQGDYDAASDDNSIPLYYHQDPTSLTGQPLGAIIWGPLGRYDVRSDGVPRLSPDSDGSLSDLIFDAATELTIASGVVAVTQGAHTIDTEADAASDALTSITGGTAEEVIFIRAANAARTVVITHGIGANLIACPHGLNVSLAEATDYAMLVHNGTQWVCFPSVLAVPDFGSPGIKADVIAESTSAAGVTVDGALIKDGFINALSGTALLPSLSFSTDPDTGWFRQASNTLGAALGGVLGLTVSGAMPSAAAATDTAGQDLYVQSSDAGGTATAARVGGLLNMGAGDGSAATGAFAGGAGGAAVLRSGAGGANTGGATGEAGGAGGALQVTAAAGGATNSAGAHAGGAGGDVTITAGAGGAASAGTGNGGAGGDIDLVPGAGGATTGGTAGTAGEVKINGVAGLFSITSFDVGATALADRTIFIADRAYRIKAIREVHATAEASAGSLDLQVTKDTGTNAPGAGTALLTNNSNAGFDIKGTANTVQTGTLTATVADLLLAAGDRIGLNYEAAGTEGAGVAVSVMLVPV